MTANDDSFTRASRGDRAALPELLARNLPRLRAYVRARSGPHLLARESQSDLVQSVCREALQDLAGFEFVDEVRFRHWLCQVAWRKLADRGRMLKAERRDPAREEALDVATQGRDEITPSRAASGREEWERMCEALDRLPDDQREAILLHRIVGLEHAEIAAQLGRSEGAVRNLVYRGMAKVALWLEKPGPA